MNKSKLKSYAPQARKDFISAVTARANLLGLSEAGGKLEVAPGERKGDLAIIAGREWPAKVYEQRERLIKHIQTAGFAQTMEAVAYTWFNRVAALRYMEIHDYLDHGHRVLSNREGGMPEILNHATELELPGFNKDKAVELKLAGNKDGELYKMLLVAQCNALSNAMPFLFERIDDETELLLPDNLLRSDSVIAKLVEAIPEEDWAEVEIIGWLYQFYISEKKDQVIGKVVKSEDIPAATQLFTPNWIVQYLVQNSVGRLWLMANPQSTMAKDWSYYITPAEQTPEVQAQLDALIQTRVREDGDTLNPESITVLDPACGSGHILVVAYDVLKAIYLERGYQPRAIPRLILEKNLYGLDIDDRAAQMAGFALLMKARADDRRLFTATDDAGNLQPPKLNVLSLQESNGLSVDELATHLAPFKVQRATIAALVDTFEHAKTFGSLIQIPDALKTHLAALPEVLALVKQSGDMYATAAADDLLPLLQQAQVLAMQFDAVVANPPYMGARTGLNDAIKDFARLHFPNSIENLYAMFWERALSAARENFGAVSMVTMHGWMFIPTLEEFRRSLFQRSSVSSLVHLGARAFGEISGEVVQAVAFVAHRNQVHGFNGTFIDNKNGDEAQKDQLLLTKNYEAVEIQAEVFNALPGAQVAYWLSKSALSAFKVLFPLSEVAESKQGMATSNNGRFLRYWHEVSHADIAFGCTDASESLKRPEKWYPYVKGGSFQRWYGNLEYVVNWKNNGQELKIFVEEISRLRPGGRLKNQAYYFKESLTYSALSGGSFSCRYNGVGFLFDTKGSCIFSNAVNTKCLLAFLNSNVAQLYLNVLCPTLDYTSIGINAIPYKKIESADLINQTERAVEAAKNSWDSYETSWDFSGLNLSTQVASENSLAKSWRKLDLDAGDAVQSLRSIEESINQTFINAYGLQDELTAEVPESQITLTRADREKDCQRLISYAIGCMMGRYSLDQPGLIYAHAGNVGFEPGRYATFPADADGIVPITDELWFADDAPSRIREFLRVVWGPDTLEENMAWLAESLGTKASETPDETIRRYVADKFFKDHLQTYKKCPIYWHFSSGRQGAFQALVYLHRYHEGTLARMRAEYVVPLTGKMQSRIEMLEKDKDAATSTAARNKIAKQIESLKKKHVELLAYDEKLRHYADMRISIDLDDGVKVNYGKFGDLLAEVKAVTGGAGDE